MDLGREPIAENVKVNEGRFEADADQLKRIQSTFKKYNRRGWKEDRIESMVVNTNQNLTNYALSQAFKKLGILLDPELDTHKRAAKYAAKKGLTEDWGSSDWYYAIESFLDDLDNYDTMAEAAYETALFHNDDRKFMSDPWSHFTPRDLVWMAMQRRQIAEPFQAEAQAIINDEYTGRLRDEMSNDNAYYAESLNEAGAFFFFVEPYGKGHGADVMSSKGDIHDHYDDPEEARRVAAELNAKYGKVSEGRGDVPWSEVPDRVKKAMKSKEKWKPCEYCKDWEDGFDPRPKTYGDLCPKCLDEPPPTVWMRGESVEIKISHALKN